MYNIARLTIFAIISSAEEDSRAVIEAICSETDLKNAAPPDLITKLEERAKRDGIVDFSRTMALLHYLDLGDLSALINRVVPATPSTQARALSRHLSDMVPTRNRVFHSRPLEPDDLARAMECLDALQSLDQLPLLQVRNVAKRLREDPTSVLNLEIPHDHSETIFHNLPLPEYDDTSLIGREKEVLQVIANLKSPYPVVSIIGEGGIGKSAVAVHSLYRILDDTTNPYAAIVWVSLKRRSFGVGGVREVENAITSAITLYTAIDREMEGTAATGNPQAIIGFMKEFPTLLVLDNLEAINTSEINELLVGIPQGSKLLITSRIRLGQLELPYTLPPLSEQAATHLMRRSAQLLNVKVLASATNKRLESFASDLHFNPLGIRWFVGSVASGSDPHTIKRNKKEFLQFCFSNMYETLELQERNLLRLFFFNRRPLSAAEVAYLCDSTDIDYKIVLNGLLSTSVLRMSSEPASGRTTYALTDFAAEFLRELHPLDTPTYKLLTERVRRLSLLEQQSAVTRERGQIDPKSLSPDPNNRDELISAAYLRQALAVSRSDRKAALHFIEKARAITPDYVDVYKVAGFIYAHFDESQQADDEYNMAIEMKPDSGELLCLYAGFLMRIDNIEKALEYAEKAAILDCTVSVRLVRGRARMFCGKYDLALEDFDSVYATIGTTTKTKRVAASQAAECLRRMAEDYIINGDPRAVPLLVRGADHVVTAAYDGILDEQLSEAALDIYREPLRFSVWDAKWAILQPLFKHLAHNSIVLAETSSRTVALTLRAICIKLHPLDAELAGKLAKIYDSFASEPVRLARSSVDRERGYIKVILAVRRSRGFITSDLGEDLFFSDDDLRNASMFEVSSGDVVEFVRLRQERQYDRATDIFVDDCAMVDAMKSIDRVSS